MQGGLLRHQAWLLSVGLLLEWSTGDG